MGHKVTGCQDCPMFEQQELMICNHPKAPRQIPTPLNPILEIEPIGMDDSGYDLSYVEWVVTPEWCPLKKEPITISLEIPPKKDDDETRKYFHQMFDLP